MSSHFIALSSVTFIATMPISISTWNSIGLGIAVGFAGLSALAVINPRQVDDLFGVSDKPVVATGGRETTGKLNYTSLATLVGGRDLAIGVSIFALGRAGKNEEMGTVILSTMLLAIPDIWLAWRNKKYPEYVATMRRKS